MVQLIKKPTVTQVVTKDGECTIHVTVDVNLNLNNSNLKFNSGEEPEVESQEDRDVDWAIPDFSPTKKVQFGKGE